MNRIFALGSILLAGLLIARAAAAVTVTLNPGGWTSSLTDRAQDGLLATPVSNTIAPGGIPEAATTPGAVQGDSSTVMDYVLSSAGFDIVFDQQVAIPVGSFSQSTAIIYFSVDEDTAYQISGSYQLTDTEGRGVYFRTALRDRSVVPIATTLFESNQYSNHTPDESFSVGLLGGDTSNLLSGSATGTLLAGKIYLFYADAALESYPDVVRTTTASGTGTLSLILIPIPEPSPALLVGLGILGMSALGRRHRA